MNDTRTMDNIQKYKKSENFVVDYLNLHEEGEYIKADGQEKRWDITGPKIYEVKSYKQGKSPFVSRKCYIESEADRLAFPEVDEDGNPLGNVIICDYTALRDLITREVKEKGWSKTKDGRDGIFFSRTFLLEQPFTITVSEHTRGSITDLMFEKTERSTL